MGARCSIVPKALWIAQLLCSACGDSGAVNSGSDAGLRDAATDSGDHDEDAGGPAADGGAPGVKPLCNAGGFCWEAPWPQGETLRAAWAASPSDVWLVGDHGSLLHFDGWRFVAHALEHEPALHAVHGTAADDVWAAGEHGLVSHYDGQRWRSEDLSKLISSADELRNAGLYAVYAAARDAVWAVGHSGAHALVLHYDGNSWTNQLTNMPSEHALRAVWGVSRQRVWATGDKGLILSYDGTSWRSDMSPTQAGLRSIHALDESEVWAVGDKATALRWDGTAWKRANTGLSGALNSVLANHRLPPDMPMAGAGGTAGMPAAGSGGTGGAAPMAPEGPWLTYAFGDDGAAFRYNGSVWAAQPNGTDVALLGGARLARDHLIAVGEHGQITRFMNDSRHSLSQGSSRNHLSICRARDAVWAVGDGINTRKLGAGKRWTSVDRPTARALYGVFCGDDTVWAVGAGGNIVRSMDGSFETMPSTAAAGTWLRAVHGAGNSLWIVGDAGFALTAAAGGFVKVATPVRSALLDVWGDADNQFWAVGEAGVVLRWDGMSWIKVPTGPMQGVTRDLRAVWGSAANDIWVGGTDNTLLHWDGQRFEATELDTDTSFALNDIWGRSQNDVYAVGSAGLVLHYNGERWTRLQSGTSRALQSISGDATHVYVAGLDGVLLVREKP